MGVSQPTDRDADAQYTSLLSRLSGFQVDLLLAIPRAEPHGQGDLPHGLNVKRRLERDRGEEINHGRLYPNLDALADHGLVVRGRIDKRTKSVTLTQAGVDALTNLQADVDAALHAAAEMRTPEVGNGD